jgi:outer membrane lipoprotein carrier protein
MKLLGFFIFPILAVLLSTAPSAGAASLTPVEGLELLRRAFAGIDDFSAGITQEKQLALMKKKMTARGEVRFKKPNMFYMELYPPYSSRVLLKDTTLTLKLSNDGERQQVTLPSEQGLGRWFRFLNQPVTSIPEGFDIRADKRGNSVILRISPRNNGALRELELTFQETGRLQKLVIEENNRDSTVITFNRMKRNTGLTDQDFRLE